MTARPPRDGEERRVAQDFDDVERITDAVKRVFIAGLVAAPLWLLLLWMFGELFGVGLAGFVLASLIASAVAGWWLMRTGGLHPGDERRSGPMSGQAKMVVSGLTVAVLVFVLILFVASRAGG